MQSTDAILRTQVTFALSFQGNQGILPTTLVGAPLMFFMF